MTNTPIIQLQPNRKRTKQEAWLATGVPKKDLEAHSFQQCATAALLLVYSRVYYYTKRGGQC